MLDSTVCRAEHLSSDWFQRWDAAYALPRDPAQPDRGEFSWGQQRKIWEWYAITQALEERDMLRPGRTGIGFAVGQEPLPAMFAAKGASVLATDQPVVDSMSSWIGTGQHAADITPLWKPWLLDSATFHDRVHFQPVDMRDLSPLGGQLVDFVWSSCSLEHLGSLEAGLRFVQDSTRLLRPGGVAVHTTEFNLSSDTATVETGDSVLYRRQDLERLDRRLRSQCAGLARLDLWGGTEQRDLAWDHEPFFGHGRAHLKLRLHGHIVTSVLLIVHAGPPPVDRTGGTPEGDPGIDMERRWTALTAEIDALRHSVGHLDRECQELRKMSQAMRDSFSWRISLPLRLLTRTWRKQAK